MHYFLNINNWFRLKYDWYFLLPCDSYCFAYFHVLETTKIQFSDTEISVSVYLLAALQGEKMHYFQYRLSL